MIGALRPLCDVIRWTGAALRVIVFIVALLTCCVGRKPRITL